MNTKKPFLLSSMVLLVVIALLLQITPVSMEAYYATCTGADPCHACKNCKYCKHCAQEGGTCGVCK